MVSDPEPKRISTLQTATRFATVGVLIAAGYVAWIFYSRHESEERANREAEAKQQAARQHQVDVIFGSGEVKIVSYSVDRPSVAAGESANLCYGVINATQVKLDPPVEAVKPSAFHCLSVAPRKTTTYTLTASNDKGDTKTLSVRLQVH